MSIPFDIDPSDETSSMTLILTGRLRKQLRECAIRLGSSQSEIARIALRDFVTKNSKSTNCTKETHGRS